MDLYEHKLKKFLSENCIQAEHLSFDFSCHSVEDAAKAVNALTDDFVKNICMIDSKGKLVLAIVKGEDRASTKRVSKLIDSIKIRTATQDEILEKTGYPCGGVPSFGFLATFLIDPKVMSKEIVYTGGGTEFSLIKIPTKELQRANQGKVVRVTRSLPFQGREPAE